MTLNGFDHLIRWSEFTQKRSRPEGHNEDAFIKTDYKCDYKTQRKGNGIIVASATVNITIQTRSSWSVTSQQTADLLIHEQGHYDINAIAAREFYNKLLTLSAASDRDLQQAASDLNDKCQQQINTVNDRYDTQTAHSQNTEQQQQWNKAIAAEKGKADGSLSNLP